ncbi:MAG: N-formylglutamate amidohydrolase [Phycisphaerales bacterium]|nr:N-formylglutamate amidohydrolase [Phycisphaerales bacterium]
MSINAWRPTFVLLSCEHAGNEVPAAYTQLFQDAGGVLATHRGYDIGALGVAQRLAARLAAPLVFSTVTRLLVDLNRSLDHPGVFSEFTQALDEHEQASIVEGYYTPHRSTITSNIDALINAGQRVLHIGIHSCTDELDGEVRGLDVSLLFDPERGSESLITKQWRDAMAGIKPDYRYPFNTPYLGTDDGLVTTLRERYAADAYAGIEVEVRQGLVQHADDQHKIGDLLADSLRASELHGAH